MKSRNKIRAIIISIGAALWVVLFVFRFCIMPFTAAAAEVNILPAVSTWSVGYVGNNGVWYPNDYQDYGMRTSPYTPVSYGTQYHGKYTGVDFDRTIQTYVNEYDSTGAFIGRIRSNSILFDYTPSPSCVSISLTIRTYDSTLVNVSLSYDTEQIDFPDGQEQILDEVHYGSDGDFYTIGNEKALIYYKYFPYDKDRFKYIRVEAVNNYGQRLKFRVVGYVHGSEVFRSGLAEFGEEIDIQNANFDYFNIYLVNLDRDDEPIPTEYIQSFRYIYGIKYYIQYPTEPPGVIEEIYPTDYIDLNGLDWYIPTAPEPDSSARGALELIANVNNRLFSAFPVYITAAGVAFLCWLLWLSARGDE